MRIDTHSGVIEFPTGTIAPAMDLDRFLTSPIGKASENTMTSAQWRHFTVDPEPGIGAIVIFDGDAIDRILIAMKAPSDASDEWSEQVELARKSRHDAWLSANLGEPPYEYEWGRIGSVYDSKGCASSIILSYAD